MKNGLSEAVKNFFVSAFLMIISGVIFLIALGETTWGIVCISFGVLFVIIGVSMAVKEKKEDGSGEDKQR